MPIVNVSIASGGTAENALAAGNYQNVMFLATTEGGWINFGATAVANAGIPYFQNVPLFLNAAEFPDITKYWSVLSATTASKIAILYTSAP